MRRRVHMGGFSLLEVSIVLIIIGFVSGGGIMILRASVEKQQYDETNFKMEVIQKALLDFRRSFNRIPCPGDLTLNITNADFGIEAAKATPDTASCSGGSPAANFVSAAIEYGVVPTRTLGLPDDYAFDGWGRRLAYGVDNRMTIRNAFISIAIDDVTSPRISIENIATVTKTSSAIYALMSHGKNGHGAYSRDGSRIFVGSTHADEWTNCGCNAIGATAYSSTLIQNQQVEDPINTLAGFDDIVVYAMRQNLRLSYE